MGIETDSGSVKETGYEKNCAGQSYLYRRGGMAGETFEIYMKDPISHAELQQAVGITLKRYPYITAKLVQKNGVFYFTNNYDTLIVEETETLRELGSRDTNQHLVDVTFKGQKLFVSFHHALIDGEGIKPFIETLLLYYCSYRYSKRVEKVEGIRMAGDPLFEGETKDPFLRPYEYTEKEFPKIERNGFPLPESGKPDSEPHYRYELLIVHDDFLNFAKKHNATPSIAAALVMDRAINNLYPGFDQPIICNSAVSMRTALNCEHTFKNCVKSIMLPYTQKLSKLPLAKQSLEFRNLLDIQRDADYLKKSANEIIGLYNKLDQIATFDEKQQFMSFLDEIPAHTYFLSYIGKFNLGDYDQYIETIRLYDSSVTGLGINIIATNKYFCIDFKQSFQTGKYVDEFVKVLKSYGIECDKSEAIAFLTPRATLKN